MSSEVLHSGLGSSYGLALLSICQSLPLSVSLASGVPVCRGLLSATVDATTGLASRLMSWVTSPFRESPPPKEDTPPAEDSENGEDEGEESAQGEGESEPEETEEPEPEVGWLGKHYVGTLRATKHDRSIDTLISRFSVELAYNASSLVSSSNGIK